MSDSSTDSRGLVRLGTTIEFSIMHTHVSLQLGSHGLLPRLGPLDALIGLRAPHRVIDRTLAVLRTVAEEVPEHPLDSRRGSGSPQRTGLAGTAPNAGVPRDEGAGGSRPRPELAEADVTMEQLVADHADAVYRVALSVTGNATLAEDVSQDVLIKAWQSLSTYRGEAPLRHWVLRITHNMSISALRRQREDIVSPSDLPETPTDRSVHAQVQDRLAMERFEAALSDLDGVSRSIVVLREIEGLSYAEMSDLLELPLPTIRTRLLRARRQLADALDGWQP